MTQSHKSVERQRSMVMALFLLSLVFLSTEILAQTKTLIIFVEDASGGLATSQAAPQAPLLDSNYVQNPLFTFLDTVGVDSITLFNPTWDPADTLYTRPDGIVVKLPEWSSMFMMFLNDSVDFESFRDEYLSMEPLSILNPELSAVFDYTPTDLFSANQPYMFPSGASKNRINATKAWDFTRGDSTQKITVIDEAFFPDHEDFAGRILGSFSYDPDYAFDFADVPGRLSHGTATTGILAATGDANPDSGLGMAGLNWKAQLYLIRIDRDRVAVSLARAIRLSNSLGHDPTSISLGRRHIGFEAIQAFGHPVSVSSYETWVQDRTIVASKGNRNLGGFNTSFGLKWPADLATVVGVGASDGSGNRAFFSNYGARIRVVAPGVNIYRPIESVSGYDDGFDGTSAATPMVAGTISLIRAANPKLLADEVEEIVYMTARDVTLTGIGYDVETGYGILDAGDAVQMAATKVVYRDGSGDFQASAGDRIQTQAAHTRTFFINYGFNGGLTRGTYTNVEQYKVSRSFNYAFGNDTLKGVIRTRSVLGWGLDEHPDSTREIAWARIDSTQWDKLGVTIETGAYRILDDTFNPPAAIGWWPCKNPPCEFAPDINLQFSILTCTVPGDANNDCKVNIADVTFLINLIYEGGPLPPVLNDGDANGNCSVDIADITYLIAWIFHGGLDPENADCVDGSLKFVSGQSGDKKYPLTQDVQLDIAPALDGKHALKMNTNRKVHALDVTLKSLNGSKIEVFNRIDKLGLYWIQRGDIVRICLVDIYGQHFISPTDTNLLEIKGDFEIVSATGVEILADGTIEVFGPEHTSAKFIGGSILPREISFDAIYPNPFNPVTNLAFSLPKDAEVTIEIYNILGQRVRTLTSQKYAAGKHTVQWNSVNDAGQTVASGVYFARFVSGEFVAKKKMVILK